MIRRKCRYPIWSGQSSSSILQVVGVFVTREAVVRVGILIGWGTVQFPEVTGLHGIAWLLNFYDIMSVKIY